MNMTPKAFNSKKWLYTGVPQIILVLALASCAAFGQATGVVASPANNTVAQAAPKTSAPYTLSSAGIALSQDALQAQVEAQQQEINELKAMVKNLQVIAIKQASAQASMQDALHASIQHSVQPVFRLAGYSPASPTPMVAKAGGWGLAPVPVSSSIGTYSKPRELLPDIGQIGAQVNLLVGGSTNPFKADTGFFSGGSIDLPLKKVPGGKLSYEILISLQKTTTTLPSTSAVTALVNGLLNVELGTAPGVGNLLGPLPVTTSVRSRSTVLTVAPVELKYTITKLGRFSPYVVAGLGTYVSLSTQNNVKSFDAASIPAVANVPGLAGLLNTLLQGSQVAGLAPEAPELRTRGVAAGQGDLRFGFQYGAGAEYRVTPKYSIGFDYRQNKLAGNNGGFGSFTFKQAVHF